MSASEHNPFEGLVYVLAKWHVKGNIPNEKIMLRQTAEDYDKHLRNAFGDKVNYFTIVEL